MSISEVTSEKLSRFIESHQSPKFDSGRILTKLQALADIKGKKIPEEILIKWIKEFKDLGWETVQVIKKITALKYKGTGGKLRFVDFLSEDDESIINFDLIKAEAEKLLKEFLKSNGLNSPSFFQGGG